MARRHSAVETVSAPVHAEAETSGDTDICEVALRSATRAPLRKRGQGRAAESKLHAFNTLPEYLADNEYIREYYRADYSIKESVQSLFRIHNETGNIWTHLLGVSLFFCARMAGGAIFVSQLKDFGDIVHFVGVLPS
jgi:hypothetical protein